MLGQRLSVGRWAAAAGRALTPGGSQDLHLRLVLLHSQHELHAGRLGQAHFAKQVAVCFCLVADPRRCSTSGSVRRAWNAGRGLLAAQ